jgi:2-octaprenylphenol hydroxylase
MHTEFDVIIVGGGMVGLSLAQALSGTKLKLLLVEAGSLESNSIAGASGFEPRVSAINLNSQQWLSAIGVWDHLPKDRIQAFTRMEAWDAEGTGEVSFESRQVGQAALGYIVENCVIQDALMTALSQSSIHIMRHTRLQSATPLTDTPSPNGAHHITFEDGTTTTCNLLIGADGHQSRVRQLGGFKTRQWDYQHQAIVTTITLTEPHNNTARQAFATDGPLGILPLPGQDQRHCSIVWSQKSDRTAALMALSDTEFCVQLTRAMDNRLGTVVDVDRRFAIPLQAQIAESLVCAGMALIGDAAHRIHPLAGQGANLGFADAEALADNIIATTSKGLAIGDHFQLRQYQRQRQSHNLAMTAAMEGFKRLFESDNIAVRWLRNAGMKQFEDFGGLKSAVMAVAMGLQSPLNGVHKKRG